MDCVPVLPKGQWSPLRDCCRSAPAQDILQLGWRPQGFVGEEMELRSLDREGSSSCGLQGALQSQRRLR